MLFYLKCITVIAFAVFLVNAQKGQESVKTDHNPSKPHNSIKPIQEPVKPVKKSQEPVKPVQKPQEPVKPVQKPQEPVKPVQKPQEPVKYVQKPQDSIKPVQKPQDSVKLEQKPQEPVKPVQNPKDSVKLAQKPQDPVKLEQKPKEPVKPVQKPQDPEKPKSKLSESSQNVPTTRPGHLESLGKSGNITPVKTIEGLLDPEQFLKEFVLQSRPVLIKGAGKASPAFSLWTDAYLRSIIPDGEDGNVDVEVGKKENRSMPLYNINMKKFLDQYNSSDVYMATTLPKFLQKDVTLPMNIQCESYYENLNMVMMWFSSGGTKSLLHSDDYENINCLFRGSKRWVMIDTNQYLPIVPSIIDREDLGASSIDVERVDLDRYPFMAGVNFYEVNMEAGDCLYVPYSWLHQVTSRGSNIAVNLWWGALLSKNVDLSRCAVDFDPTRTLDKCIISQEADQMEANAENVADTLQNLRFILFTEESKKISAVQFLKILLDKEINKPELKTAAMKMLKIIYGSRKDGFITDEDMEKLSEEKMVKLFRYAQIFDQVARAFGMDMQLTKGPLFEPIPEEENFEDDYIPYLDESIYKDLGSTKQHGEL